MPRKTKLPPPPSRKTAKREAAMLSEKITRSPFKQTGADHRVKELEKEISYLKLKLIKFLNDSVKTKDALDNIEKWRKESFENIEMKNFAEKLHKRLEQMDKKINEISERHEEIFEKISNDINALNKKADGIKELEGEIKKLDLKYIKRDIESLKTKAEWIENNIEKIDLEPLLEKITEMESKIRVIRLSSPVIIE